MAKKVRKWEAREMRLVSEWIAREYPDRPYRTNVRLGSLHPRLKGKFLSESELRMAGVFRRWADALVFLDDRIILIEGAIRPQPGDISVLRLYKRLIPNTPDLAEYSNLPVEMVLLCSIPDPVLVELAREDGIRVVVYRPKWIEEYMEVLYPRERTATLTNLGK